jgi:general secretion pathway protein D
MLVLGGLMREDTSEAVRRVPCIGAVPVIGEPFKYTEKRGRKVNLMVFLRPRIIRTDSDIKNITNEKYSTIQSLYEKPFTEGTILLPRQPKELPEDLRPAPLKPDETAPSAKGLGAE